MVEIRNEADLQRLNGMAATLVRRLFESAYRKQENRHSRYMLTDAARSGIPATYRKVMLDVEAE